MPAIAGAGAVSKSADEMDVNQMFADVYGDESDGEEQGGEEVVQEAAPEGEGEELAQEEGQEEQGQEALAAAPQDGTAPPAETDPQAQADAASQDGAGKQPEWVAPIVQMQQQTAQMFQQMQQQQIQMQQMMLQQKQEADQQLLQIFQSQQAKQRARDLEAQRPQHPGEGATREQIEDYVNRVAQYNADLKLQSLQSQMGGQVKSLQSEVEKMKAALAQERQQIEQQRADQYVQTTIDSLARTPGLEFMRSPEAQEIFLDRWYAASARGDNVDPRQIAGGLSRFFAGTAPRSATDAQKQLSRNKRAAQNNLGAPRTVRAGGSMTKGKSPEQFAKETLRMLSGDFEVDVG